MSLSGGLTNQKIWPQGHSVATLFTEMPPVQPDVDAERQAAINLLYRRASQCTLCPRLAQKRAVVGAQSGPLSSLIMFIAEAPGRNGAAKTGIPLHGDPTGQNFEWLLAKAGLSRNDVYVTNAVLCNPLDEDGHNSSPTSTEIRNCSTYLRSQIDLVRPRLIVTLGAVALSAVGSVYGLHFSLAADQRRLILLPDNRHLVPLFHPSPRVMATRRPRMLQLKDFRSIKPALNRHL